VIDVREAVPHNLTVFRLPHFFFQYRTLRWPGQYVCYIDGLRDLSRLPWWFFRHLSSILQVGHPMP
jgi:hypothetical protein